MTDEQDITNVTEILETIEEAGERPDKVFVSDMLQEIGSDAFAPVMLVPALLIMSPASAIPGLPTISALIIALAASQLLTGRNALWMPGFVTRRSIKRQTLETCVRWLGGPAAFVDRVTGRRLVFLTDQPFSGMCALACLLIALVMPFMEVLPLSSSIAATAIAFLTLGLTVRDGILVLIGMTITTSAAVLVLYLVLQARELI